jgi:Spy/CpxP family protein refolding chaperone
MLDLLIAAMLVAAVCGAVHLAQRAPATHAPLTDADARPKQPRFDIRSSHGVLASMPLMPAPRMPLLGER